MADGTSGVFVLPMLRPGPGDRRDGCARYAGEHGCLSRFVRAEGQGSYGHGRYWRERDAHCEPGCPSYAPAPRWAAVAHAHAYGGPSALAEAAAIEGDTPEGEPLPRHGRRAVGR